MSLEKLMVSDDPGPRPDWCGGGLLRVDRQGLDALKAARIRFDSVESFNDGERYDARVACRAHAVAGRALCSSCERLEFEMRGVLQQRAVAKTG